MLNCGINRLKKFFKRPNCIDPGSEIEEKRSKNETLNDSDNNDMYCWGKANEGALGIGPVDDEFISTPRIANFEPDEEILDVSCGRNFTVILTKSGKCCSCGENSYHKCGRTSDTMRFAPVENLDGVTCIACGYNHVMTINELGQLYGWGSHTYGQIGDRSIFHHVPTLLKEVAAVYFVQIACGKRHTLALANTGQLYSWGDNRFGQLGHSSKNVDLLPELPIAAIACGAHHSCAVSRSGAIFSWGFNNCGQLGLNDIINRHKPEEILSHRNMKIKHVVCGEYFTAFLTADGGVFTCGDGRYGQLGHGSLSNELIPRKISEFMGSVVTQIACGSFHMLAFVPATGHVYAFGSGTLGQLGVPDCTHAATPQIVPGLWKSQVTQIFTGNNHCFVKISENDVPVDQRVYKEEKQIVAADENIMKRCANVSFNGPVDDELFSHLEILFTHVACINGSFLMPDNHNYFCSKYDPGIDWIKAQQFFAFISQTENESINDLVYSGITKFLSIKEREFGMEIEALRAYLIFPLYHNFDNVKHARNLQVPYAKALFTTNRADSVRDWLTSVPIDYFERLVRIFKDCLLYLIMQEKQKNKVVPLTESMRYVCLLLQVLKKTCRLPCDAFYLPELKDAIDLMQEHRNWQLSMDIKEKKHANFCEFLFLFDVETKIALLQIDQRLQMQWAVQVATVRLYLSDAPYAEDLYLHFHIDRSDLVRSTINQLMAVDNSQLKKPLKIKFLNEEGEDAGGVSKEFFLLIIKEVLDQKYGMFTHYNETRSIWFNEFSFEEEIMFSLIGNLCGLAIYNFTIIDVPFPLALYKKIRHEKVTYKDLKGLSPMLYKSLQDLLDYDQPDFDEVFCLTFQISRERYGENCLVDLKEGLPGETVVTQANKKEYVDLYADYILNKSIQTQFDAFLDGFNKVCGNGIMKEFHAEELMALVVGNENYDWEVFEATTKYEGVYWARHPTILLFWEVFHKLSLEEKKAFLMFLTGCDRIPISGMKTIMMTIQPLHDERFLPVAHTCFNLLDLPPYKTKEKLKFKLVQAIQNNQGFSLI